MIFDKLKETVIYTIIDMVVEYQQVRIQKENIFKIAFVTVWRQYKYLKMPFGLCNTLAIFQRLMNHILYNHLDEFVMIYLDNVVIYFKNMAEYIKHLDQILDQLKQAGLKIKMKKYEFTKSKIKLLSY